MLESRKPRLIVRRKRGERIVLSNGVEIDVLTTGRDVKLAISAPRDVRIDRGECLPRPARSGEVFAQGGNVS
jgi:sRNA-binding carbon storage regulator CsrA